MTATELLAKRIYDFALRVVKVTDRLSTRGSSGRILGSQLLRAGSSIATNYEEARAL